MSSYYSLDDIGINAAHKEQQFKYSAAQHRLHRVLIDNRKTEAVNRLNVFLGFRKTTGLLLNKIRHDSVISASDLRS